MGCSLQDAGPIKFQLETTDGPEYQTHVDTRLDDLIQQRHLTPFLAHYSTVEKTLEEAYDHQYSRSTVLCTKVAICSMRFMDGLVDAPLEVGRRVLRRARQCYRSLST